MNRQLREGGGIMSLSKEGIGGGDYRGIDMGSRTGFGLLKKISRGVKKVAKGVKSIAKSDVGKAALAAAAAYYAPGIGIKAQGGFAPFLQGAKTGITNLFAGAPLYDEFPKQAVTRGPNILSKFLGSVTGGDKGSGFLTKGLALAGLSTFLTSKFGMTPAQAEETIANPESRALYLRRYYENLNPNAAPEEVEEFVAANVAEYMAEGGRIGFAEGPVLPPDPTQPVNPFGPKPGDFGIDEDIPIKMASNIENDKILEALFEKYLDLGFSPKEAADKAKEEFDRMSMMKKEGRGVAALGGRIGFDKGTTGQLLSLTPDDLMDEEMVVIIEMGPDGEPILKQVPKSQIEKESGIKMQRRMKAKGDTASMNAMQAAGIEGLPVRQNPKGVKELDLRKTGVFTADAVRGAGGGDVNVGAQRMYDTMKRLEAGGKA